MGSLEQSVAEDAARIERQMVCSLKAMVVLFFHSALLRGITIPRGLDKKDTVDVIIVMDMFIA